MSTPRNSSFHRTCDIFCTVIDNFGDAGVCWRLARQLAADHGWRVRLIIDDAVPLRLLAPGQNCVEVMAWAEDFAGIAPADIVIEAFACDLPADYVRAMRERTRPPVWINLEYLSAEAWVAGCHGLPSPQAGLDKYFFFPGFVPGTGGLLRGKDYTLAPAPSFSGTLEVSLFCYANPALPELLAAWRDSETRVICHVAAGLPQHAVAEWMDIEFDAGATVTRGNLTLRALPFLPQSEYDALLARCHLNFVRGEDSFVCAQWAGRPFVWQAYPQADNAHIAKLDAFLARYGEKVGAGGTAILNFMRAWNGIGRLDWPELSNSLPLLAARALCWSKELLALGDLATNLADFCAERL